MRQVILCIAIGAVLVSAGCATDPRRGPPAPVVGSHSAATTERGDGDESASYPLRGSAPAEIAPYSTGETGLPEAAVYPDRGSGTPTRTDNSAVLALLSSADRQRQGGDVSGAAATLERALRIEPRNARLWHQLAALRLDQARYRLAADLADKSNSLAPDDAALTRANWALIARARSAMGDEEGARQARRMGR